MRKLFLLLLSVCTFLYSQAQEEPPDTTAKELGEVIISFNKWELKQNEVPNKITKISKDQILRNNPQTSATEAMQLEV